MTVKSEVPNLKKPSHPWRMNVPLNPPKEPGKLPNHNFRTIPK